MLLKTTNETFNEYSSNRTPSSEIIDPKKILKRYIGQRCFPDWLGPALEGFSRLDERGQSTIKRLLITASSYLFLGIIIGALNVFYVSYSYGSCATCAAGFVNLVAWVWADAAAMREWKQFLCCCCYTSTSSTQTSETDSQGTEMSFSSHANEQRSTTRLVSLSQAIQPGSISQLYS